MMTLPNVFKEALNNSSSQAKFAVLDAMQGANRKFCLAARFAARGIVQRFLNHMRGGQWVGVLFYVGFYFAAFTSAIGLCEAVVSVVMEMLGLARKKALGIVILLAAMIGSCSIALPGFLDAVDNITSNYLLVLSGLAITLFVGWAWGTDNLLQTASVQHPLLRLWLVCSVKYLCPLAIGVIFLGNFF